MSLRGWFNARFKKKSFCCCCYCCFLLLFFIKLKHVESKGTYTTRKSNHEKLLVCRVMALASIIHMWPVKPKPSSCPLASLPDNNFHFCRQFAGFDVISCPYLTLKWPRYFYSRWCPRGGGFHGTPPEKTTFPPGFCNEICTIYVRDIKNHNSAKKNF